jgi:hypothetical protein
VDLLAPVERTTATLAQSPAASTTAHTRRLRRLTTVSPERSDVLSFVEISILVLTFRKKKKKNSKLSLSKQLALDID